MPRTPQFVEPILATLVSKAFNLRLETELQSRHFAPFSRLTFLDEDSGLADPVAC
jgi:hypothetical protein